MLTSGPLGIALWLGSGLVAFLTARLIPFARGEKRTGELILTLFIAFACGVAATALDFGGWNEPDWRAGLFAFFGAAAAAAAWRLIRLVTRRSAA